MKILRKLIFENLSDESEIQRLQIKIMKYREGGKTFTGWTEPWKLPSEFYEGSQLKQEYIRECQRYYPYISEDIIFAMSEEKGVEPKDEEEKYKFFEEYVIKHHTIETRNKRYRYEDISGLIGEISGYPSWGSKFRSYQTLDNVIDGFIVNNKMAMPLNLQGTPLSGNTRIDLAYMLGIPVKIIRVSTH